MIAGVPYSANAALEKHMRIVFILALGLLLGPALPSTVSAATDQVHQLGPRDLIQIRIYQQPDLTQEIRIDDDGTVTLPLIGQVHASGLTVESFMRVLNLRYKEYLLNPEITVSVKEYYRREMEISVLGEVGKTGFFRFAERSTLLDVLAQVGGLKPESGDRVIVLRPKKAGESGVPESFSFNSRELYTPNGVKNLNIELREGDTVMVPQADQYFISGEVVRPGAYKLDRTTPVTVPKAIILAGGLTEKGGDRVLVRRAKKAGESQEPETVIFNAEELAAPNGAKSLNVELREGDTVMVPPADQYFIFGEVARPGAYKLDSAMPLTVLKAIILAGGLTEKGGDRAIIRRAKRAGESGEPETVIFNAQELSAPNGAKSLNIELRAGDTVMVAQADQYFIFGEIARPGAYKLDRTTPLTVLKAIILAGGFTDKAKKTGVKLTRGEGAQKNTSNVDLETPVRSQDIIIVPESFF